MRMWTARPTALLLVFVLARVPAADAGSIALDLEPAWNGAFKEGEPTEMTLRVLEPGAAPRRYTVTYFDRGDEHVLHEFAPLVTGVDYHLPLTRARTGIIELSVGGNREQRHVETTALTRMDDSQAIIAVAASLQELPTAAGRRFLYVSPKTLPIFPQSYRTIDMLIVDADAYGEITSSQRRALANHIESCGHVVLHRFTSNVIDALRAIAGCHGGRLNTTNSEAALTALLVSVNDARERSVSPADLASLLNGNSVETIRSVLILLGLYLCVAAALVARTVKTSSMMALSLLVTAAMFLTWSGSHRANARIVTWSDVSAGADAGNYASLVRLAGNHRGTTRLASDELLQPVDGVQAIRVESSAEGLRSYVLKTTLLQPIDLVARGRKAFPDVLDLSMDDDHPVVCNPLDVASPPSTLAFRDTKYDVPALAAGASWRPDIEDVVEWSSVPLDRLFRRESLSSRAALLLRTSERDLFVSKESFIVVRL